MAEIPKCAECGKPITTLDDLGQADMDLDRSEGGLKVAGVAWVCWACIRKRRGY